MRTLQFLPVAKTKFNTFKLFHILFLVQAQKFHEQNQMN